MITLTEQDLRTIYDFTKTNAEKNEILDCTVSATYRHLRDVDLPTRTELEDKGAAAIVIFLYAGLGASKREVVNRTNYSLQDVENILDLYSDDVESAKDTLRERIENLLDRVGPEDVDSPVDEGTNVDFQFESATHKAAVAKGLLETTDLKQSQIAQVVGRTRSWVSLLSRGETRKDVEPETEDLPDVSGFDTTNVSNKLSGEDVREIRNRYPTESAINLAGQFDVSKRTIYNVVKCKTHKHIS